MRKSTGLSILLMLDSIILFGIGALNLKKGNASSISDYCMTVGWIIFIVSPLATALFGAFRKWIKDQTLCLSCSMTVALVIGTAISFLMKDLFAAIPFNAYYEILYALCLFSLLFLCT